MTRTRRLGIGLALALSVLTLVAVDAARRRGARDTVRQEAVVVLVGMSDLALSSSVRWLRHPSQSEPGAPFSDVPASVDVDPAGGWIAPPREVLREGGVEVQIRGSGAR